MSWSDKELRQLRLRLGWSLSEMARRLGCHQQQMIDMESGRVELDPEVINQCHYLNSFLEEQCQAVQKRPLAEILLKERRLEQISEALVLEWELDQNKEN